MITADNLTPLLKSLGFTQSKSLYSKTIGAVSLSVEVTKQTIHYPEPDGLVVNERQTCNFSANENFLVPVISLDEQNKFVAKVEALEKQIAEAQAVIDAAPPAKRR